MWELPSQGMPKVGRNDPCPCGSGHKFKRCHGAQDAESHPRRDYQQLMRTRLEECLHGDVGTCGRPAIRAHSVQNSQRVMGLIAEDGLVVEAAPRGQPPRLKLGKVGRRRATTFTGLCADHDAQTFRPLDQGPLDVSNPEHLFLLAYRAVIREHHVLRRAQDTVRRLDSLPQHSGGPSLAYHDDVVERFSRFRYDYFEPALRTGNFDFLQSRVETIDTASATVAVSSLYSLDLQTRDDGDIARVALSVIPVSQRETVAVASYIADDHPLVEPEVGQFFDGPKESLPLRLSRLILETSENFVLRPGFAEGWSEPRKRKVLRAAGLLSALHSVPDDPELMLFDV